MDNNDFIRHGFKPIEHFTIGNSHTYDIGRNRFLSAGSIGTPNEMIFLCERDEKEPSIITDLICIHNYDYDGYMTEEKLIKLIEVLDYVGKSK